MSIDSNSRSNTHYCSMLEAKLETEIVFNGSSNLAKKTTKTHSGMIIDHTLVSFTSDQRVWEITIQSKIVIVMNYSTILD